MGNKTPLFEQHVHAGARMVDFGGWDMPVHYGSQIEEHHAVRRDAGVFDVSHMTVTDVTGEDAKIFLSHLLANDVDKLASAGKALYSCMLDDNGGILDDLIVYRLQTVYRLVTNCGTREKDLAWIEKQSQGFSVDIRERQDLAILAIQGPATLSRLERVFTEQKCQALQGLGQFECLEHDGMHIATTGYTGEAGFEVILPADAAVSLWESLLAAGIQPVGLGARDTLRLEAGMNLYGSDMDASVTPLESGLAWTLAMKNHREFIGRSALERQQAAGVERTFIGLVMEDKGVIRSGYKIFCAGDCIGEVTSGIFSPTLGCSIALARVKKGASALTVEIRNRQLPVLAVKPPFVRQGKKVYKPF
ncbi:MAG: glycine cleavage system aminomethyltransferase GcvT [Gammaproteobacteria bacterium]|nr:glycine cleavage system aminomethyltransferase GcvT [Gammaproteobacteria bacterium]